ncbi:hypothetical protein ACFE04_003015 [Oxalis oulophora]
MAVNMNKAYVCNNCGKSFGIAKALYGHMGSHSRAANKIFRLATRLAHALEALSLNCNTYPKEEAIDVELVRPPKKIRKANNIPKKEIKMEDSNNRNKEVVCQGCSRKFPSRKSLGGHKHWCKGKPILKVAESAGSNSAEHKPLCKGKQILVVAESAGSNSAGHKPLCKGKQILVIAESADSNSADSVAAPERIDIDLNYPHVFDLNMPAPEEDEDQA